MSEQGTNSNPQGQQGFDPRQALRARLESIRKNLVVPPKLKTSLSNTDIVTEPHNHAPNVLGTTLNQTLSTLQAYDGSNTRLVRIAPDGSVKTSGFDYGRPPAANHFTLTNATDLALGDVYNYFTIQTKGIYLGVELVNTNGYASGYVSPKTHTVFYNSGTAYHYQSFEFYGVTDTLTFTPFEAASAYKIYVCAFKLKED